MARKPAAVLPPPSKQQNTPRGLRIEDAAAYIALSPFFIEELIRNGTLPAFGGPNSGICSAYVVLREHLDEYLDGLGKQAIERANHRRKQQQKERAA
jgi:hypothetical protein